MRNYKTAKDELDDYSIITQFYKLKESLENPSNNIEYNRALYNILKYIKKCTKKDPINGDYYCEKSTKLIKEAGELLNKKGGINGMNDVYIWSFIPKRYRNEINYMWDGIGEWVA